MVAGADDRPIGLVSFWDRAIPHEAAELSIWIGQGHRDEGNGTEALSLALRYGFTQLSLHKIYLRVLDYNARAIRAYEKVGFRVEGHLREEMNVQGEWHDLIYMGVLEAEFAAAEAGGAAPSGPGAAAAGGRRAGVMEYAAGGPSPARQRPRRARPAGAGWEREGSNSMASGAGLGTANVGAVWRGAATRRSWPALPLLGVAAAACGGGGSSATGQAEAAPVTLDWWNETDMDQPAEEAIKADWAQRFPRITLQPTKVPYGDYTKKILTVLVADTAPDVTYTHQDWTATFAQKKVVAPLDELVKRDRTLKLSDYYPAAIDFQRWGGKLYGLSWIMEGSTLFYNRNLIEQAGLEDPNALDKRGQWTFERLPGSPQPPDPPDRQPAARLGLDAGRHGQDVQLPGYRLGLRRRGPHPGRDEAGPAVPARRRSPHLAGGELPAAPDHRRRSGLARGDRRHRADRLRARQPPALHAHRRGRWGNVYFPVGRNGRRAHRAGCSGHGIVAQSKKEAPAWELVKHLSQQGNRHRHGPQLRRPPVAGGGGGQGVGRHGAAVGGRGDVRPAGQDDQGDGPATGARRGQRRSTAGRATRPSPSRKSRPGGPGDGQGRHGAGGEELRADRGRGDALG